MQKAEAAGDDILKLCVEVGGCLTGEHGVGIEKRDLMRVQFTEADLEQQMRVRAVFDPAWLLNPAKVFPLDGRWIPDSEADGNAACPSPAKSDGLSTGRRQCAQRELAILRRSSAAAPPRGREGRPRPSLIPAVRDGGRSPDDVAARRRAPGRGRGRGAKPPLARRRRHQGRIRPPGADRGDAVGRRADRRHPLRARRDGDRRAGRARRWPRSWRTLAEKGQELTFEPVDYRAPARHRPASRPSARWRRPTCPARAASWPGRRRDSLIGVRFVNGRGEVDQVAAAG